ncbi:hypothetical protein CBM2609_A100032 [Cupriavidus taiwanensis]|nr:hypothetical protein CBM2604_A80032 [Cupriavidus taiwanensis]SOZ21709.1 hypothetical protein CBM2609_A100032 [Cupriavidus taiwanensis]
MSGLGMTFVNGLNLVPKPPATINVVHMICTLYVGIRFNAHILCHSVSTESQIQTPGIFVAKRNLSGSRPRHSRKVLRSHLEQHLIAGPDCT